jgi:hypothetical protein
MTPSRPMKNVSGTPHSIVERSAIPRILEDRPIASHLSHELEGGFVPVIEVDPDERQALVPEPVPRGEEIRVLGAALHAP